MIDVQHAVRITGWMITAQHALKAVAMQNTEAKAEPHVSGFLG
jgi:hypothetical protein